MSDVFEQQVQLVSLGGPGIHRQVLYDASRIQQVSEQLFEPLPESRLDTGAPATGRAPVVVHVYEGRQVVSRHYHRGGMVAALLGDRYLGRRAENSRGFREWCMLSAMKKQGLPVPVPIAASRIQSGLWYRADLVTELIPDAMTLADSLLRDRLASGQWRHIGRVIRRFHNCNVYHADLNARNILITGSGAVYLIDFDNCRFRKTGKHWREQNLSRLRRSLDKLTRQQPGFHFETQGWQDLLAGYAAGE